MTDTQKPKKKITPTYCVIDTETTSLDSTTGQLLTLAMIFLDQHLEKIAACQESFVHDRYVADRKALETNQIDLRNHKASYKEQIFNEEVILQLHMDTVIQFGLAKEKYQSLKLAKMLKECNKQKLLVIGSNPEFDIGFLKAHEPEFFEVLEFRHSLDTAVVGHTWLLNKGKYWAPHQLRLGDLIREMEIPHDKDRLHDAEYDAELAYLVYRKAVGRPVEQPKDTYWIGD